MREADWLSLKHRVRIVLVNGNPVDEREADFCHRCAALLFNEFEGRE